MKKLLSLALVAVVAFSTLSAKAEEKLKFALVTVSTAVDFWRAVDKGMDEASEMLGVECDHLGPNEFDIQAVSDTAMDLLTSGIDGISLFVPVPGSMDKVIEAYKKAGVPIMVLNTGGKDAVAHDIGFDGFDNFEVGVNWGKMILASLGPDPKGKKVCFSLEAPGQASLEGRKDGAISVLEPAGVIYDVIDTTNDRLQAYSVIENYFLANPDCVGFFSTDTTGAPAAGAFLKKNGLVGKIVLGGFDLIPEVIELVDEGVMAFTADQYPYQQGFLSVLQLFWANKYGMKPFRHFQPGGFITKDNVAEVKELSKNLYR